MLERFTRLARWVSDAAGSPYAFVAAVTIIIVWLLTGPFLGYSDTWQLIINTGTTIVTFLMVFLIQGATNRSERALQLKLDEILCSIEAADNRLIAVERDSDDKLEEARTRVAANKV